MFALVAAIATLADILKPEDTAWFWRREWVFPSFYAIAWDYFKVWRKDTRP